MSDLIDFAYSQARLQSRYGELPDEPLWRRLEASRSLPHFLQSARNSPLKPWLADVGPHSAVHDMELSLRRQLRRQVKQVAAWHPKPWQQAVRWLWALFDLPLVHYLVTANPPLEWMFRDEKLAPVAAALAPLEGLAQSDYAPLLPLDRPLPAAWLRRWRHYRPGGQKAFEPGLVSLERLLQQWHAQLQSEGAGTGAGADEQLMRQLRRLFRRRTHQPAAALAYLLLLALNLRRLRGALVRRALFSANGQRSAS